MFSGHPLVVAITSLAELRTNFCYKLCRHHTTSALNKSLAHEQPIFQQSDTGNRLALILLAWLAVFPAAAFAGHGVEDSIDTIPAERVKLLLDSGEKIVLIDLRPTKEFEQNRLPGARSLPMSDLEKRFSEIPKSGRVVLYCACKPNEVADKAVFLEYRGYRNIFVMLEGYPGWVKRGYPVEATRK